MKRAVMGMSLVAITTLASSAFAQQAGGGSPAGGSSTGGSSPGGSAPGGASSGGASKGSSQPTGQQQGGQQQGGQQQGGQQQGGQQQGGRSSQQGGQQQGGQQQGGQQQGGQQQGGQQQGGQQQGGQQQGGQQKNGSSGDPQGGGGAGGRGGMMLPSSTSSGVTANGTIDSSGAANADMPGQRPNTAQPQQIDRAESRIVVNVRDPQGDHRTAAIEWNPLALVTLGKLSFNVVIVPKDHHALVLSPHYQWAETAPIYKFADPNSATTPDPTSRVGEQHFKALGGEIGYRYYSGIGGMRGWFIGPSLIADAVWANPLSGPMKHFADLGLALDAGYQVLLGDDISLGLGAGIQGMLTTSKIPDQQFPAHTIANRELNPRVLLSLGWAF